MVKVSERRGCFLMTHCITLRWGIGLTRDG